MQRILGVLAAGAFAMLAAGSEIARAADDCDILKEAYWKNDKIVNDLSPFIDRVKSQMAEALEKYDEKRRRADETKSFSDLNYATIAHLEFQRLKKELAQTEARFEKEIALGQAMFDRIIALNCHNELPADMQHLAGSLSDDYRKALREEQRSDPASYNKRVARLREQANMKPLPPPDTTAPSPPPPRAPKAAAAPSPLDEAYKAPNINDCAALRQQLALWESLTAGATARLTQNEKELLENKRWLVGLWGKGGDNERAPDSATTWGEQRITAQSEIGRLQFEIARVSEKLDEAKSAVSDLRMLVSASPDCDKDKPQRPDRQAGSGSTPATATGQSGTNEPPLPDLPASIIELLRELRKTNPNRANELEQELRQEKRREANVKPSAPAAKPATASPPPPSSSTSGKSCPPKQVRMWCGNLAQYSEDCYEPSVAQQKAKEHLEKNKNSDCQIDGKYVEKPTTTPSPAPSPKVLPPVALKAVDTPVVLPPLVLPQPQVASAPEPMLHTPPQPPPQQHSVPQPPKEQKHSKRPQPRKRANPGPSQAQAQAQAQQEAAAAAAAIAIIGAVAAGVAASSSGPSYHRPAAPSGRAPAPRHH